MGAFSSTLDNDLHVHVSVIFNHPSSLVVTGNLCRLQGETPLVIATRNGHTQVVDFIKSRLPQGEYIVTVYVLVYYIFSYITEGYPLLEILLYTCTYSVHVFRCAGHMPLHVVLWGKFTTLVVVFSAPMPKSSGVLLVFGRSRFNPWL